MTPHRAVFLHGCSSAKGLLSSSGGSLGARILAADRGGRKRDRVHLDSPDGREPGVVDRQVLRTARAESEAGLRKSHRGAKGTPRSIRLRHSLGCVLRVPVTLAYSPLRGQPYKEPDRAFADKAIDPPSPLRTGPQCLGAGRRRNTSNQQGIDCTRCQCKKEWRDRRGLSKAGQTPGRRARLMLACMVRSTAQCAGGPPLKSDEPPWPRTVALHY